MPDWAHYLPLDAWTHGPLSAIVLLVLVVRVLAWLPGALVGLCREWSELLNIVRERNVCQLDRRRGRRDRRERRVAVAVDRRSSDGRRRTDGAALRVATCL
jgi:hypothetical protein